MGVLLNGLSFISLLIIQGLYWPPPFPSSFAFKCGKLLQPNAYLMLIPLLGSGLGPANDEITKHGVVSSKYVNMHPLMYVFFMYMHA